MVAALTHPDTSSTFLAIGQQFHADDIFSTTGSQELTVTRLVRNDVGLLHVVLRDQDNREISAFAEQIELAITLGNLQPLDNELTGLAS